MLQVKCCTEICKKSGLRCFLSKNHTCRHKFTPSHLLSPSAIHKVLLEVTSGEIKSLAGLDNTDVLKGYENFLNMRSFISTLEGIIQGDEAKVEGKRLRKEIDWIEQYHKVNFL